jgi:hypothetical protein
MADEIVGVRKFSNGRCRNVFEDARGQYVLNEYGDKVRGSWIVRPEELLDPPTFVEEQSVVKYNYNSWSARSPERAGPRHHAL